MILHREVRQPNRAIKPIEAPRWVAVDPVARRDEALCGELVWAQRVAAEEETRQRGRLGHPPAADLRSYRVMVEEKIERMPNRRQYLCEQPARVWVTEYRLVSDEARPDGFEVEGSVPSAGPLGAVLGRMDDACRAAHARGG